MTDDELAAIEANINDETGNSIDFMVDESQLRALVAEVRRLRARVETLEHAGDALNEALKARDSKPSVASYDPRRTGW